MTEPWVRIAELEKEVEGLHTHADLVESDRDAMLAVVRAAQSWIENPRNTKELGRALAALPEHLK